MSDQCFGDQRRAVLPTGQGLDMRQGTPRHSHVERGAAPAAKGTYISVETEIWAMRPARKVESARRKALAADHAAWATMTGGKLAPSQADPARDRGQIRTSIRFIAKRRHADDRRAERMTGNGRKTPAECMAELRAARKAAGLHPRTTGRPL